MYIRTHTHKQNTYTYSKLYLENTNISDMDNRKQLSVDLGYTRPQFLEKRYWLRFHDSRPAQFATLMKCFPMKCGGVEKSHTPYLLVTSPANIFAFLKVQTNLKAKRFQDVEDIKKNVTVQ